MNLVMYDAKSRRTQTFPETRPKANIITERFAGVAVVEDRRLSDFTDAFPERFPCPEVGELFCLHHNYRKQTVQPDLIQATEPMGIESSGRLEQIENPFHIRPSAIETFEFD
jgi:hypothetical protein